MANIEINDIALKGTPVGTDECELQETGGGTSKKYTIQSLWDEIPKASQVEAEAGAENTKQMTSLRTKQAIDALSPEAPANEWELFKTQAVTSDDTETWSIDGLDLNADEEYRIVVRYVHSQFGASFNWNFYINDVKTGGQYNWRSSFDRGTLSAIQSGVDVIFQNNAQGFDRYGSFDEFRLVSGSVDATIHLWRYMGRSMGCMELFANYKGTANIIALTLDAEADGFDIGTKAWVYRRRQTL